VLSVPGPACRALGGHPGGLERPPLGRLPIASVEEREEDRHRHRPFLALMPELSDRRGVLEGEPRREARLDPRAPRWDAAWTADTLALLLPGHRAPTFSLASARDL